MAISEGAMVLVKEFLIGNSDNDIIKFAMDAKKAEMVTKDRREKRSDKLELISKIGFKLDELVTVKKDDLTGKYTIDDEALKKALAIVKAFEDAGI